MKRFLQDLGYDVTLAATEKDSLALMSEPHAGVGLILLNERMLSSDAFAAGRRIRYEELTNLCRVM